jgi:hypothetical protein
MKHLDPVVQQQVLDIFWDGSLKSAEEIGKILKTKRSIINKILTIRLSDADLKLRKKERSIQAAKLFKESVSKEVIALFKQNPPMGLDIIARKVGTRNTTVSEILKEHFTAEEIKEHSHLCRSASKTINNPMTGKFGELHHNFIGLIKDGNGYYQRLKPEWCTENKDSPYVFEHRLVMLEALGLTELPAGFAVHHINGDKSNNQIENLALVTHHGHRRIHQYSPISEQLTSWELKEFMTWKSQEMNHS